jgi:hypothetical protein
VELTREAPEGLRRGWGRRDEPATHEGPLGEEPEGRTTDDGSADTERLRPARHARSSPLGRDQATAGAISRGGGAGREPTAA